MARASMLRAIAIAALSTSLLPIPAAAETYRLVYAIDNDETLIKKDISEAECRALKAKLIASGEIKVEGDVEDPDLGVLSCLPESLFE